ncbi:unnamed protein product [Prorocentrum cordatum]|uniref:Uncharacterized protein n=1 Tax=Prorocentrum cordatum TaxID=2364126 RepID=A0ABN9R334_9DINO|nr:unnamed protein product [Polarella glacialis]
MEHKRALATYQAETARQPPARQAEWQAPVVGDLFDDIDEYDEEDRTKLTKFKHDLEAFGKLLQMAAAQYRQFNQCKQQADTLRTHAERKRKAAEGNEAQIRERKEVAENIKKQAEQNAQAAKGRVAGKATPHNNAVLGSEGAADAGYERDAGGEKYMITMCETHLDGTKLEEARGKVARDGRKMMGAAAAATKRSEKGTTGGDIILSRTRLARFGHDVPRRRIVDNGEVDPFRRIAALSAHARSGNAALIAACLVPGEGFTGFIKSLTGPWVAPACWNILADRMEEVALSGRLGGAAIRPDVKITCDKGRDSLIDRGTARVDFATRRTLVADGRVPWRNHCGLSLEIKGTEQERWHRQLETPKALPYHARPRKATDPNTKASRKKQAQNLQEAHEEATAVPEEETQAQDERGDANAYIIEDGIWEKAGTTNHNMEPVEEMLATGDRMTIGSEQHKKHENLLAERHSDWVAEVEEAILQAENMTSRRTDAHAIWASNILAIETIRCQPLVPNGTDDQQQRKCIHWIRKQLEAINDKPHKGAFGKHAAANNIGLHFEMAGDITELDLGQFGHLVEQTEMQPATAPSRPTASARKSSATWAKKARQSKAGAPRGRAGPKVAPKFEADAGPDFATADPTVTMNAKAKVRENIWTDPMDERKHCIPQLKTTRRRAVAEDREPIDVETSNRALRATSASKAKGLGQLGPADIDGPPLRGKQEPMDRMGGSERHFT